MKDQTILESEFIESFKKRCNLKTIAFETEMAMRFAYTEGFNDGNYIGNKQGKEESLIRIHKSLGLTTNF